MKALLFIIGAACGIIFMGYLDTPRETALNPNKETILILQTVEADTFLQRYILSPQERERTRRAKEMFDKKYPK